MKNLIKFLSIIGLALVSHLVFAIENAEDGDRFTADMWNEVVDTVNANSVILDFDIELPCTVYKVGDTGPALGLVFFVTEDGCDGLEAWTADEVTSNWGCLLTATGAVDTGIGKGASNTLVIINEGCTDGDDAADLTRLRNEGGQTDWYLPSKNELSKMYHTIGPGGTNAGNFDSAGFYWSSSEDSAISALVMHFPTGDHLSRAKDFLYLTRAIRTFNQ